MDKINNKIKTIIHKPGAAIDSYKNLKYTYTKFVSDMQNSDFCNSPQRYLSECKLLRELKELAEKKGSKNDFQQFSKLLKTAEEKLAEWGIEISP